MTSARIDRREQMALQTRRDILQAARRLFAERGYGATSVKDIADQAGVAVQTIYARLGSKRGMLDRAVDLIDEEAGVGENAAAVPTASTPADVLRSLGPAHPNRPGTLRRHHRRPDHRRSGRTRSRPSRRRRSTPPPTALASPSTGSPSSTAFGTSYRQSTQPRYWALQEPTRPGASSSTPTNSPGIKPNRR